MKRVRSDSNNLAKLTRLCAAVCAVSFVAAGLPTQLARGAESAAGILELVVRDKPKTANETLLGMGFDLQSRRFIPGWCVIGERVVERDPSRWQAFAGNDPAAAERAIVAGVTFRVDVATDYGSVRQAVVGSGYLEETFLQRGETIDLRPVERMAPGVLATFVVFTGEAILRGERLVSSQPAVAALLQPWESKARRGRPSDIRELLKTCGDFHVGAVTTGVRYSLILKIPHDSFSAAKSFRARAAAKFAGPRTAAELNEIYSQIEYQQRYYAGTAEGYPHIDTRSPGSLPGKIVRAMAAAPVTQRARLSPTGFARPRSLDAIRATMARLYPEAMHAEERAALIRQAQVEREYRDDQPPVRLSKHVRSSNQFPSSPVPIDLSDFNDRELREGVRGIEEYRAFLYDLFVECLRTAVSCLSEDAQSPKPWSATGLAAELLGVQAPQAPCQQVDRDGNCRACEFVVGKEMSSGERTTWEVFEPLENSPPGYGHRYECGNLEDGLYQVRLEPGAYLEVTRFNSRTGDVEIFDDLRIDAYALELEVVVPRIDGARRGLATRAFAADSRPDWDDVGLIYALNVQPQDGLIAVALRANACHGYRDERVSGFCKLQFGRITVARLPDN